MSLVVNDTPNSADDCGRIASAMAAKVSGLKAEAISGVTHACLTTDDPKVFLGTLEIPGKEAVKSLQPSAKFAGFRERASVILTESPNATPISAVAGTRN